MTQSNSAGAMGDDELARVSAELAGRLMQLGIPVSGTERPEEILAMVEAVDRFESAVESRGGDLMMDEGQGHEATEPDDRHFALPVRREQEPPAEYVERLARATDEVRHHPPRAD